MSKANDLTGRTFVLLKVLRRVEDVKPGRPMWLCECRCGKSVVKSSTSLTKQNGVKSCGCLRHQKSPELIDLTDMTFGDLRVLYQDCSAQSGKARWVCQCGCGNVVSVLSKSLRRSKTTSCGCKCQVSSSGRCPAIATAHAGTAATTRVWISVRLPVRPSTHRRAAP